MTGLEKMQNQILDEARKNAEEILEQAKKEAAEIREAARMKGQEESSRILEKSRIEVKNTEERSVSSCALQKRQVLLETKQEIIAQVLEKAYHTLTEAEEETYFQIIRKMLGKYAAPQEGEICFSKKDLERMPKGFEKEIQAIARENKGDLVLSKETREIGGGFILIYGGIEENCSFQAMFNARKDELSDKVHEILFS
mgnify:FL=1